MATGRRDYTHGFLLEVNAQGRYTEPYFYTAMLTVPGGEGMPFFLLTIPANHRICINKVLCGADYEPTWPHSIDFRIGTKVILWHQWRLGQCYDLSDQNPLYANAGEYMALYLYNGDISPRHMNLCIIGAYEELNV
jgi:hypothetical protein